MSVKYNHETNQAEDEHGNPMDYVNGVWVRKYQDILDLARENLAVGVNSGSAEAMGHAIRFFNASGFQPDVLWTRSKQEFEPRLETDKEFHKIKQAYREYIKVHKDGTKTVILRVDGTIWLNTTGSGHRIVCDGGKCYYIGYAEYNYITWESQEGEPHFQL